MIECVITSPDATAVYKELGSVSLPAFSGEMQILPGHAETFAVLRKGTVILRQPSGKIQTVKIDGGECHIKDDRALVIL